VRPPLLSVCSLSEGKEIATCQGRREGEGRALSFCSARRGGRELHAIAETLFSFPEEGTGFQKREKGGTVSTFLVAVRQTRKGKKGLHSCFLFIAVRGGGAKVGEGKKGLGVSLDILGAEDEDEKGGIRHVDPSPDDPLVGRGRKRGVSLGGGSP